MNTTEITAALVELERQMDLFPRVFLGSRTFNVLFDAVGRHANRWDYETVLDKRWEVKSYMLTRGDAEAFRDQVRTRIAHLVTEQLTGTQK